MKLGPKEILYMKALDEIAGVPAKDCLIKGNQIIFLIDESFMGKAIGRKGALVKILSDKLGKQVELVAYDKKPDQFVKKMLKDLQVNSAEVAVVEGKKSLFVSMSFESKRKLLNNASKLKKVRELLQRDYGIDSIRLK